MCLEQGTQPAFGIEMLQLVAIAEIDEHRMTAAIVPRGYNERSAVSPGFNKTGDYGRRDGRMISEPDQSGFGCYGKLSHGHRDSRVDLAVGSRVNNPKKMQMAYARANF